MNVSSIKVYNHKLSIIIPVYNTFKYLAQCIDSVLMQRYSCFELILVDDGSMDGSSDICNKYAKMDSRICVVHKNNGGVSSARNIGLFMATGQYISFIDSDDWIDQDYYFNLINIMEAFENVDICVSGLVKEGMDNYTTEKFVSRKKLCLKNDEAIFSMMKKEYFSWELCDKIYRSELFKRFVFNENLFVGEDFASNWELFNKAKGVFYDGCGGYHYRMHVNSTVHSLYNGNRIFLDALRTVLEKHNEMQESLKQYMVKWYIKCILNEIFNMYFWDINKYQEKILSYKNQLKIFIDIDIGISWEKLVLDDILALNHVTWKEKFDIEYQKICKEIKDFDKKYKNVYIYGTGVVSRCVVELLEREKVMYAGFVVSDNQNSYEIFNGHKVYKLSQLVKEKNEIIFLLALNPKHTQEVSIILTKYGYKNFYWPSFARFF